VGGGGGEGRKVGGRMRGVCKQEDRGKWVREEKNREWERGAGWVIKRTTGGRET